MLGTTVDIEFLAKQGHQILNELRSLRKEVSEVRTLTLQTIDYSRRVERRTSEMRDDLELMIKAELSGGLANMGTQLDNAM